MKEKNRGNGYILLHRSILTSEVWQSDEPYTKRDAWIELLLFAQHSEYKGAKRGEYKTSQAWLAKRWKWSRGKVSRFLEQLVEQGNVTTHRATNGTTVTLVNYDKYQCMRSADEATYEATKRTPKRAAKRTQTNNDNTNNDSTMNGDNNLGPAAPEGWVYE